MPLVKFDMWAFFSLSVRLSHISSILQHIYMSWRSVCVSSQEKLNVWAVEICIFYRKTQFIVLKKKVKWGKSYVETNILWGWHNIVCASCEHFFFSLSLALSSLHVISWHAWILVSLLIKPQKHATGKTQQTQWEYSIALCYRFHSFFVSFSPRIKVVFCWKIAKLKSPTCNARRSSLTWMGHKNRQHTLKIYTNEIN